jgi:4-amino-4-deoxy-L-arabinose transferase-like glycosyltransferase
METYTQGARTFPGRASIHPAVFWSTLLALELAVFALHLPGVRQPHVESDEVIFTFLAERLRSDPLQYHVRGRLQGDPARRYITDTWARIYELQLGEPMRGRVLDRLRTLDEAELLYSPLSRARSPVFPPELYDRPLFFHPPLYPYSLALFRCLLGAPGGPALSALLHGATILLVALLGRHWDGNGIGLVSGALVAIEPTLWLAGQSLWTDGMLTTLVTAAVLTGSKAVEKERRAWFLAAGVCFALACLTKLPAVLVAPAILAIATLGRRRPTIAQCLLFLLPSLLLVVPWLVFTRVEYGAWIPAMGHTEFTVEHYPTIRLIVERPAHFYGTGLLITAPVFVYAVPALWRARAERWLVVSILWSGTVLLALTLLGIWGLGFNPRFVSLAMPALCILAAAGIDHVRGWLKIPAVVLAGVTAISAFWSGLEPASADAYPHVAAWVIDRLGYDSSQVLAEWWIR